MVGSKILVSLVIGIGIFCVTTGCEKSEDKAYYNDAKLDEAAKIWKSNSMTSKGYAKAAHTLITHFEEYDNGWLTLGNVIKKLGRPSGFLTDIEYVFDEFGNVVGRESRTQMSYDNKNVIVSFSATGFLDTILYEATDQKLTGWSSPSWPQEIQLKENATIVTGTFDEPKKALELTRVALEFIEKNPKEIDWYRLIVEPECIIDGDDIEIYGGPCSVRIISIDGITQNIARLHYHITGKHNLYYDTWWQRVDSQWKSIPSQKAKLSFISAVE